MIPEIGHLTVMMHGQTVGRLAMNKERLSVFEYDAEWLKNGFSISPFYLPLESGIFTAKREPFDGLFGVFNDSLPDGWGHLIVDRWLREHGVNPRQISWVERLAVVGNNGMGALCYKPEVVTLANSLQKPLSIYEQEVKRILLEEDVDSLDHWIEKAGSPGGARPKILLKMDDKQWLIKFAAQNDPPDIGEIEYRYAQTASESGIEMPETRLFDGKYFGAVRFDRKQGQRVHMLTASGLLHASHRYPSLDYTDLMKATFYVTQSVKEVEKVYRRMVFNVLTHNQDDHAKNFSFLHKHGKWVCSPAYDVVYSHGFNGNHSTTINGKGNPERTELIHAGVHSGLDQKMCEQIFDEVRESTIGLVEFVRKRFG